MTKVLTIAILIASLFASCKNNTNSMDPNFEAIRKQFQSKVSDKSVDLYRIKRGNLTIYLTNYGGRLVSIFTPDASGNPVDVNLGYNSIEGYMGSNEKYFGALIGRFANRIAGARFTLDGQTYQLVANNGTNQLHGGPGGFHNVVWDVVEATESAITLQYESKHLEENYPGNLQVKVEYSLDEKGGLKLRYQASTDQMTILNLTSHPFFNLNGDGSGDVNDHILKIDADSINGVNDELIPLSENMPVSGTPFDFQTPVAIGQRIYSDHIQLERGMGYDHNFILKKGITRNAEQVAVIYSPKSGIELSVSTTEPGLQFYGGNFLDGSDSGKNGVYERRGAFCLETQHFPDSPNRPDFPSVVLKPGQKFESETIYRFGIHQ